LFFRVRARFPTLAFFRDHLIDFSPVPPCCNPSTGGFLVSRPLSVFHCPTLPPPLFLSLVLWVLLCSPNGPPFWRDAKLPPPFFPFSLLSLLSPVLQFFLFSMAVHTPRRFDPCPRHTCLKTALFCSKLGQPFLVTSYVFPFWRCVFSTPLFFYDFPPPPSLTFILLFFILLLFLRPDCNKARFPFQPTSCWHLGPRPAPPWPRFYVCIFIAPAVLFSLCFTGFFLDPVSTLVRCRMLKLSAPW